MNQNANHSIKCSVTNCTHHCPENYCTLNEIKVGCTVGERTTVGMGAILLNGCQNGPYCLVAAGALVPQNAVIPAGSLVMDAPAKVKRPLRPEEYQGLLQAAEEYRTLSRELLPAAEKG